MKIKLEREYVLGFLGLRKLSSNKDFVLVETNHIINTEWSEVREIIIKRASDGKYFKSRYSIALTEDQDEEPWEYEKEVEFTEVVPKEKTITVKYYEEIK